MVTQINLPIQMICVCSTQGDISPIRFRFEDNEHHLQSINISETISKKEINTVGIKAYSFICKALTDYGEKLFELKYTISTSKWILIKFLY